ncbi:OmpA family protein [Nocardia sp. NPDC051052]|uniref:OmpA family protein n=1 Tax=Nocardia sp. NPDC051052 TaxID=3364322 RepID=UPI0037B7062C
MAVSSLIGRLLAAGLFGTVALGLLPACTNPQPNQPASSETLVITGTSAEPRPALSDSLRAELEQRAHHAQKPGDATVRIISSATGPIIEKDLVPVRSNGEVEHASAAADRKITTGIDDLAELVADAKADTPGLSTLPLLDRAGQIPNSDIHVLSSLVTTENPTDLRVLGWDFQADNVSDGIERQGELPDLAGHTVTFEGIGIVAGSQPRLAPFARTAIANLWVSLCQRMGASSCTAAQGAVSVQPPISTLPVPVVPVPTSRTDGGCPVWATLSDSELRFAPNSAVLGPEADVVLLPIIQAAQRCNLSVDIAGHIADIGTAAGDSSNLSGRRAQAVADRLIVLGLPSQALGTVIGRGATEPVIPNFTGGQFDESKAQQNRRTELSFHRLGTR